MEFQGLPGTAEFSFAPHTESRQRPGILCLACLLVVLGLVIFTHFDFPATATEDTSAVGAGNKGSGFEFLTAQTNQTESQTQTGETGQTGENWKSRVDPVLPHSSLSYTLTYSGKYAVSRLPNSDNSLEWGHSALTGADTDLSSDEHDEEQQEVKKGGAHIFVVSRHTIINSIRLTRIRIVLDNAKKPYVATHILLNGLDLANMGSMIYHGVIKPVELEANIRGAVSSPSKTTKLCNVSAAINFNPTKTIGLSLRDVDTADSATFMTPVGAPESSENRHLQANHKDYNEQSHEDLIRQINLFAQNRSLLSNEPFAYSDASLNHTPPDVNILPSNSSDRSTENRVQLHKHSLRGYLVGGRHVPNFQSVAYSDTSNASISNTTELPSPIPTLAANVDGDNTREERLLLETRTVVDLANNPGIVKGVNLKPYSLSGRVVSVDCGFSIDILANEVDMISLSSSVVKFCFAFSLKVLIEIRLFLAQMAACETNRTARKISIYMLTLQLLVDSIECVFILSAGFQSNFMLPSFAIMALFKLVLVTIVEMRFLLIVWRAQLESSNSTLTAEDVRRESAVILRRIVTALVLTLFFFLKVYPSYPFLISPLYCIWVPQIVTDVWRGQRRSVSKTFLLGLSFCRLLLPIYCWGLPNTITIFDGEIFETVSHTKNVPFVIAITTLMVLQVGISLSQRTFGSRFFVPASLLPDVYDYYRVVPELVDKPKLKDLRKVPIVPSEKNVDCEMLAIKSEDVMECVICMGSILLSDRKRVVTPCDHFFHEVCLRQWMDIKMECPTCRGLLPPFA